MATFAQQLADGPHPLLEGLETLEQLLEVNIGGFTIVGDTVTFASDGTTVTRVFPGLGMHIGADTEEGAHLREDIKKVAASAGTGFDLMAAATTYGGVCGVNELFKDAATRATAAAQAGNTDDACHCAIGRP